MFNKNISKVILFHINLLNSIDVSLTFNILKVLFLFNFYASTYFLKNRRSLNERLKNTSSFPIYHSTFQYLTLINALLKFRKYTY